MNLTFERCPNRISLAPHEVMVIRSFQVSDRQAVIDLWKRVFPDDPPHNEPAEVLDAKLKVDDLIFVADSGEQIVGACMAGYDGHRGWLYAVAVDESYRRHGVGRELVLFAIDRMKKLGCIKVNLQIRADNHAVADFYSDLGFETEQRLSMGLLLNASAQKLR